MMFIGIGIGSVSADMKKILSAIYRIGRFEKWDLSVLIGIGRYEKKLIGRTLSLTDQPEAIDNLEEVMEVEVDEIEEILDDDTENDAIIELAPELEAASTDQPEAIVNPEEVTKVEVDEIEEILDDDTETEIDAIIEMAPEPEESSTDQPEAIDNAEVEVEEIDDEEESLPSTEKPEQPKQLSFFSENDKMEEVSDIVVPDSDSKDLIPRQDNDVIVEEDVEITTMKPVIEIVTNSSKLPKSIEIIVQDVRLEEELQTNEIVQAEGKQNINLEDEDHSIVSNDEAFVNEILEDNTNADKIVVVVVMVVVVVAAIVAVVVVVVI